MKKMVFHLLPNAHIDPVWMWDWRDGLSEGVRTCRTILTLMDEYPELTFMRGESAIYEHIEARDPETFVRIKRQIAAGRWEPVGGQYIQPDNNMPSTWTALRQFRIGSDYFRDKFGVTIEAGWLADAFGHGRGTPEVFTAAGLKYFAFCRPQERICAIGSPLFRWRGQGGSELLCARVPGGAYASERVEDDDYFPVRVIERVMREQADSPLCHQLIPFGLGDHGGGPTREHIDTLLAWREKHPEVEVRFSTLHEYFRCAEAEAAKTDIPVFESEVNFCQRGCYSSTMKLKRLYRKAEAQLERANKVQTLLTEYNPMSEEVKGICFNAFHDILPGTIIESALHQQLEWLGGIIHAGRTAEFRALTKLGSRIDTQIPSPAAPNLPEATPYVVFNPWPYPWRGLVEIDFAMDSRPVWDYREVDGHPPVEVRDHSGNAIPFQLLAPESHALVEIAPWRKRAVFELALPACGWQVVTLGYQPQPEIAPPRPGIPAAAVDATTIANEFYRVAARSGDDTIRIRHGEKELGLRLALFADPTGSWGDMSELPENSHNLDEVERWHIEQAKVIESGPLRAVLWVRFAGAKSRIELTLRLNAGREALDIAARCYWMDRSKRLKLLLPPGEWVDYDVPGGVMRRGESASVPGGRHQRVYRNDGSGYALLTDTGYGFEHEGGHFAAIVARGCRHSTDVLTQENDYPEHPIADHGELLMNFVLAPFTAPVERLAEELEQPPVFWLEASHPGPLGRLGSAGLEFPDPVLKLLDIDADGLTVQNRGDTALTWRGVPLPPWRIVRVPYRNTPPS